MKKPRWRGQLHCWLVLPFLVRNRKMEEDEEGKNIFSSSPSLSATRERESEAEKREKAREVKKKTRSPLRPPYCSERLLLLFKISPSEALDLTTSWRKKARQERQRTEEAQRHRKTNIHRWWTTTEGASSMPLGQAETMKAVPLLRLAPEARSVLLEMRWMRSW